MAITKTINISGKDVVFKASATIPRLYRHRFQRDIFKDIEKLGKTVDVKNKETSEIPIDDLEIFENMAYVMALHADPNIEKTPEDWLDQFDTFSIYEVLPQLLELWSLNTETEAESKKNLKKVAGK